MFLVFKVVYDNATVPPEKAIIEEKFLSNIDYFENLTNYLINQSSYINCYIMDNELIIEEIDSNYNCERVLIDDEKLIDSFKYVLIDLGYKKITKEHNEVIFLYHPVQQENGHDSGIKYILGEIESHNDVLEEIKEDWFYYLCGYV